MIPYPYVLRRRMMIQDTGKLPPMGRGFANYTWAELDAISKAGLAADYFTVGETRNISLSYTVDGTNYSGTYELAIHGINHDILADGSGKAGLTIGFNTVLDGYRILHSTNTPGVSWSNCDMRTTYLPNIFASLPAALRSVIKTVTKGSTNGIGSYVSDGGEYITSQNQMFLPAVDEVDKSPFETDADNSIGGFIGSIAGVILEGTQYEYFATESNQIKYDTSGVAQRWRTRTIKTTTNDDGVTSVVNNYISITGVSTASVRVDVDSWTETGVSSDDLSKTETTGYYYIAPLFCI